MVTDRDVGNNKRRTERKRKIKTRKCGATKGHLAITISIELKNPCTAAWRRYRSILQAQVTSYFRKYVCYVFVLQMCTASIEKTFGGSHHLATRVVSNVGTHYRERRKKK